MKTGIELIKKFEGCRQDAYLCPAGVWTIGYGHTAGVKKGDWINVAKANELLLEDYQIFENAVLKLVKVKLNDNQLGALVSFSYNLGIGNLAKSTLLKLINQSKFLEASKEFEKWNKAGGKILKGLVLRREAEKELFLK